MQRLIALCAPERDDGIYQSPHRWAVMLGCVSIFGYALFKLAVPKISDLFLAVMVILFFVALFRGPAYVRREPTLLYAIAALALGLFTYINSNLFIPQYAEPHPFLDILFNFFLFYVVAWWLGGDTRKVMVFLALALAGLLVAVSVHGTWNEVRAAWDGQRVGFGLRHPQHTAMLFAVGLLGWIVFATRIVGRWGKGRSVLRIALWLVVLGILFLGVVVTQTRASWLGLLVATLTGLTLTVVNWPKRQTGNRRVWATAGVAGLLVLSAAGYGMRDIIGKRVAEEHEVVEQFVAEGADKIPESSIGIRIKLWNAALPWIAERPLMGWGYTGRSHVISDSPKLSPEIKAIFGHLHNSYIEVMLIYGATGMLLLATLSLWVGARAWREWWRGHMPTDVFNFGCCFFAFWLVVNMFESYLIWSAGVYLATLVGGTLHTYYLSSRRAAGTGS